MTWTIDSIAEWILVISAVVVFVLSFVRDLIESYMRRRFKVRLTWVDEDGMEVK